MLDGRTYYGLKFPSRGSLRQSPDISEATEVRNAFHHVGDELPHGSEVIGGNGLGIP